MWPRKFKRAQGILMLTSKAPQSLEKSILDDLVNWKWNLMHFPTMIHLHASLAVKLSPAKSSDASMVFSFFSVRWIFTLHNQYKFFLTCIVSSHSYLYCLQCEKLPCIFPAPWGATYNFTSYCATSTTCYYSPRGPHTMLQWEESLIYPINYHDKSIALWIIHTKDGTGLSVAVSVDVTNNP